MRETAFSKLLAAFCVLPIFAISANAFSENIDPLQPEIKISDTSMVACAFNGVQSKIGCLLDTGGAEVFLPNDVGGSDLANSQNPSALPAFPGCVEKNLSTLRVGDFESAAKTAVFCPDVDFGIITVPALGEHVWKFDFNNHSLQIIDSLPADLASAHLYRSPEGHIGTKLGVGDTTVIGLLDTGSPNSLMDISVLRKFPSIFSDGKPSGVLTTSAGKEVPLMSYKVTGLEVNGQLVNLPKVYVYEFAQDPGTSSGLLSWGVSSVLGRDLLHDRVWSIDLKNAKWTLGPETSTLKSDKN